MLPKMPEQIKDVANKFQEKLKPIRIVLFDVDGILTDGRIYYSGEEVGFNRQFHTQDGYGMKILMKAGLKVGIISGGNSLGVKKRFELLGLNYIYLGNEDKRHAFNEIKKIENATDDEILYMGDEFFDIPLLKKAGFSASLKSSSFEVQAAADYLCERPAGYGCVREVIDILRLAQEIVPDIADFKD
jgi:3-deoxy-D-manno-octulosonate 8-phosphate phosphatase (KDO 8-P phosphatase)